MLLHAIILVLSCDVMTFMSLRYRGKIIDSFRGTGPVATDLSLPLVVKINIGAEVS
jgi:hypothetical protein